MARRLARLALGSVLIAGGAAAGVVAASSLEPGAAAAPADATLSPEEADLAAHMDPDDRARYLLQREIAERAELAALVSQAQKLRHETAVDVIDGIR